MALKLFTEVDYEDYILIIVLFQNLTKINLILNARLANKWYSFLLSSLQIRLPTILYSSRKKTHQELRELYPSLVPNQNFHCL